MRIFLLAALLSGCVTLPEGTSRVKFNEDSMDCYLIAVDAYHPTWRWHNYDERVFKKERECMDERGYAGIPTVSERQGFTKGPGEKTAN